MFLHDFFVTVSNYLPTTLANSLFTGFYAGLFYLSYTKLKRANLYQLLKVDVTNYKQSQAA